jgi:mRNA deadenylase 3'-5' endonuclease subunit Ccr4
MSNRTWTVPKTLRVMTWNTLANICADQTPQGFPFVDAAILDFDHRKTLLIDEIALHDPDVLCLQEVDKYDEWFKPQL